MGDYNIIEISPSNLSNLAVFRVKFWGYFFTKSENKSGVLYNISSSNSSVLSNFSINNSKMRGDNLLSKTSMSNWWLGMVTICFWLFYKLEEQITIARTEVI